MERHGTECTSDARNLRHAHLFGPLVPSTTPARPGPATHMHEQLAMEFETPQALPDPVAGRRRGRALRDAAMQRAVEHADAVRGEWRLAALEHFRRYAQVAADREFTTGEVR